jgi:hypothetical protein
VKTEFQIREKTERLAKVMQRPMDEQSIKTIVSVYNALKWVLGEEDQQLDERNITIIGPPSSSEPN